MSAPVVQDMGWVALRGIMAAQVVLATNCPQEAAVAIIDRHMKANAGRVTMKPTDVCSMILLAVAEAREELA